MHQRAILSLAARIHEEGRRNLLQRMKAEGLDELTTSCGDIFMVLFAEEGQSLTAIAQKIRRTKSTTSVMADRLEKQGYIVKQVCPDDARASVICLTPKGRALKPMMMEISEKLTDDICAGLTDEEADALEKLFALLDARYRSGKPTLFTTQYQSPKELGHRLMESGGDKPTAQAIVRRVFGGGDYQAEVVHC